MAMVHRTYIQLPTLPSSVQLLIILCLEKVYCFSEALSIPLIVKPAIMGQSESAGPQSLDHNRSIGNKLIKIKMEKAYILHSPVFSPILSSSQY